MASGTARAAEEGLHLLSLSCLLLAKLYHWHFSFCFLIVFPQQPPPSLCYVMRWGWAESYSFWGCVGMARGAKKGWWAHSVPSILGRSPGTWHGQAAPCRVQAALRHCLSCLLQASAIPEQPVLPAQQEPGMPGQALVAL